MPKFKTVKLTTPGGYEYDVQVVDDATHASVQTPKARVGTEELKKETRTEDKQETGTADKQGEAPESAPKRKPGRRPGAAARRTSE